MHDVWKATDSLIAREALERIGALYDVEAAINGQPRDVRHAMRQKQSRPKVEAFRIRCERQLTQIPGKGDLAKAMGYALTRWASFTLFLDDGRVAIDNNAAERALKAVVLGRKNFLFAGSDAGGEILADAMTVIETANLSGINPEAYLTDILGRIRTRDPTRLDELGTSTNPFERRFVAYGSGARLPVGARLACRTGFPRCCGGHAASGRRSWKTRRRML